MDKINEETLSDIVLLSNTPTFLFKRYRRDSSVQELGTRLSAIELANSASLFGTRKNRSFLDKIYTYAYIVALSFKTASEIRHALEQHPLPPIEWAVELAKQAIADAVSETRKIVTYVHQPIRLVSSCGEISTTLVTLYPPIKPTLAITKPVISHSERKVFNLD